MNDDFQIYRTVKERNTQGKMVKYKIFLDREIMGLSRDDPRVVIHKNGNSLDCRVCNLEIVSRDE